MCLAGKSPCYRYRIVFVKVVPVDVVVVVFVVVVVDSCERTNVDLLR